MGKRRLLWKQEDVSLHVTGWGKSGASDMLGHLRGSASAAEPWQ